MSTTSRTPALAIAFALGATVFAAIPAYAQPATARTLPGDDAIPEVVVTARRVRENLQMTPISVTALSGVDLEERGATTVLDIAQYTPSLTITPGANYSGKSALAYIRGVGQDQFTYAFEPGVGFYVDEVYFGSVYGSLFEMADIDNVQVLRGPQGTLFGKNNEAGAILLSTPEPKGDNSGDIKLGYGSYRREFLKASADLALIKDTLALGLAVASNRTDGYVDRIDFACANPGLSNLKPTVTGSCKSGTEGGDNEQSLRATLKWTPSTDLTVFLKGDYHRDRSEAGAETVLQQRPTAPGTGNDNYNQLIALAPIAAGGLNYGIGISSPAFVTGNPFSTYATYKDPGTGYSVPPVNDLTAWDVSSRIEWDTPWAFHVKNVLAYQKYHSEFANTDGTPIPTYLEDNILDRHELSDELQLSGKALGNRMEWIAGAYFNKSHGVYGGQINLPTLEIVPFALYGFNFTLNDPTDEKSTSVFAHGIYHLTERLGVEVGARYSADSKTQGFDHNFAPIAPAAYAVAPPGVPVYPPGAGGETSAHRVDPKLSLQYQWTPALMTYVGVSTGYKMGGINPKPIQPSDIKPFKEEKLTAYEAGIKSEWFDRHLIANADVYLSDYRDIQLSQFLPPPLGDGGTIVVNAGHARIKGVELDLQARPVAGLQIDAAASYLDFSTLSLGDAAGQVGGPTLSTTAPYVPRWKASLGAQYTAPLGDAGSVTARLDDSYQSTVYFDLANTAAAAQTGYGLINAHLAWSDDSNHWRVAVEVANLADKLYYVAKVPTLDITGAVFTINGTPGIPRTAFVTIERRL